MRLMRMRMWLALVVSIAMLAAAATAHAITMNSSAWSGSGPGATSVTNPPPACINFGYSMSGSAVWSMQTWNFNTTAAKTETLSLNWNYAGFHAWYSTHAGLQAWADGPGGRTTVNLQSGPVGGGFNWNGTVSLNVTQGYAYGFTMQGKNFDSDSRLIGNLKVCDSTGVAGQTWTSTGPGSRTITPDPTTCVTFNYAMSGPSVWSMQTWNLTQIAAQTEQVTLSWKYSGFHAWFATFAGLTSFADGPGGRVSNSLGSGSVYGGFNWSGTTTLTVHQGQPFGFTMQGRNFDSDSRLIGTLTVCVESVQAVDLTPPTITASATTANGQPYVSGAWTNQDVTVTYTCADPGGSGVASCPAPQIFLASGTASGTATDNAGNSATSSAITVNIDKTAPTVTASATTANGQPYASGAWTNQDVTVTYACADPGGSGVASCPAPQTFSASGTASGTATDNAGNSAASSAVTVSIDKTAPTVTWSGNAGTYTVDQTVAITCAASDDSSGLAGVTGCDTISGNAYDFGPGTHSYTASATDAAGNSSSATVSFTVQVTFESLNSLISRFVSNAGVANALMQKISAAQDAMARGQTKAASNQLEAFVNQLDAQTGKAISPEHAALLKALVGNL